MNKLTREQMLFHTQYVEHDKKGNVLQRVTTETCPTCGKGTRTTDFFKGKTRVYCTHCDKKG